jgi:uncharacterized membrane protein
MIWLIVGLVLFLGAHSVRIFAEDWRTQTLQKWGEKPFKGVYALLSLLGFYALIVGYGEARLQTVALWNPPVATRHISVLLMVFASILLVAAYVPRNHFKARLKHPMVLSVKVWALAHLLANGNLADVILFGSFLVWAVLNFRAARARDRAGLDALESLDATSTEPALGAALDASAAKSPKPVSTLVAVVLGLALWGVFTFVLHAQWIGISPMGRVV